MSQILIRDAIDSDIGQIQQIYAYHVLYGLGTFEEIPPLIEEMCSRLHEIQALNYPFLVAEQNQQIIGFSYVNYYRERSAYRYTVEDSVYIDNNYRGQQIGQTLLTELILRCKQNKYKQIIAVIGDSGNHGSIKLHEKLGFKFNGKLTNVGYKFNQWVDVILMQLELE